MRFVDASLWRFFQGTGEGGERATWHHGRSRNYCGRAGVEQREQPKSAWSTKPFNYEQIIFTEKLPARASFRTTEFFPFKGKKFKKGYYKSINPFLLYLPDYSFHFSQPTISKKPSPLLNRIPGPGPSLTRGTERMLGLVPAGSRGCTVGVP